MGTHRRYFLPALIVSASLVLFSVVIITPLTPFGSATSPDSLRYLDIASNIRAGNGWVTTDLSIEKYGTNHVLPRRVWGPGYPHLLSFFIQSSSDVQGAATLSTYLFFLTTILSFLILSTQLHWSISFAGSLFISLSLPLIVIYTYAWSETLFIPLLLLALYASMQFIKYSAQNRLIRTAWTTVLLLALVLLGYTRYIGFIFILLFPITYVLSQKDRWNLIVLATAGLAHFLSIGLLLYSNIRVTGFLSGMKRGSSNIGILQNVNAVVNSIKTMLPNGMEGYLIATSVLLIIAPFLYVYRQRLLNVRSSFRCENLFIMIFSTLLYAISLVLLRSHIHFDEIDVRSFGPAVPLLLISVLMTPGLAKDHRSGWKMSVLIMLIVAVFAVRGSWQFYAARENWGKYSSPLHPMSGKVPYNNFTFSYTLTQYNFVKDLLSDRGVLVVDRPLMWKFIYDVPIAEKPRSLNKKGIVAMGALPEGSLLIINKSELSEFEKIVSASQGVFYCLDLGNAVAIKLPVVWH